MQKKYQITGIGSALMDVIASVDEQFLNENAIVKGSMSIIDTQQAVSFYDIFQRLKCHETAGGSVANTIVGAQNLGTKTAFIGKMGKDRLGQAFHADLQARQIVLPANTQNPDLHTGRCFIAVTPDGERSMSTFLGANQSLTQKDIDTQLIKETQIVYLEGYLFDVDAQKQAFIETAHLAHQYGSKIALTLSDKFCVDRHRGDFMAFVDKYVDILFANEEEILSLYQEKQIDALMPYLQNNDKNTRPRINAVTKGSQGSYIVGVQNTKTFIHNIAPSFVDKLVDTTGAGDQYAAGVLSAYVQGHNWQEAGRWGSLCASEVISHYGAHPNKTPLGI